MYYNSITVHGGKIVKAEVYDENGSVVATFDNEIDFRAFYEANIDKYQQPEVVEDNG